MILPQLRGRPLGVGELAVSRAVAFYPLLCELCLPYVKPGGVFLAMKSVESEEEVAAGASAVKRLGAHSPHKRGLSCPALAGGDSDHSGHFGTSLSFLFWQAEDR